MEYDIPIQMHSGAGDAPLLDVKLASPLLMHSIVSDPHYQAVKIIFIHTAYPFVEEVGFTWSISIIMCISTCPL